MASLWRIGSVDIYALGHDPSTDIKLAKLTVLDANATSVVHFFGSGAEERSLSGWIFSEANVDAVQVYANAGTTIALTSNRGNEGNFIIQEFQVKEFGPYMTLQLPGHASEGVAIYKFSAKLIKV